MDLGSWPRTGSEQKFHHINLEYREKTSLGFRN